MREELKKYIKNLYLKSKVDAERFKKLNAVADDLLDANDKTEEHEMLFKYASGDYPEFRRFLTKNRLRAAEDLETIFLEKIDEHLDSGDTEKAGLIMEMLETINA